MLGILLMRVRAELQPSIEDDKIEVSSSSSSSGDEEENKSTSLNSMQVEDLEFMEVLGQGLTRSKVHRAKSRDDEDSPDLVVKVVVHDLVVNQAAIDNFEQERRNMEKLGERCHIIIQIRQVILKPDKLYMVMEYVAGRDISYYLQQDRRLSEDTVKWIAIQIVMALGAVHDHGYIYSELKPE